MPLRGTCNFLQVIGNIVLSVAFVRGVLQISQSSQFQFLLTGSAVVVDSSAY
jgi:hypothetical protein